MPKRPSQKINDARSYSNNCIGTPRTLASFFFFFYDALNKLSPRLWMVKPACEEFTRSRSTGSTPDSEKIRLRRGARVRTQCGRGVTGGSGSTSAFLRTVLQRSLGQAVGKYNANILNPLMATATTGTETSRVFQSNFPINPNLAQKNRGLVTDDAPCSPSQTRFKMFHQGSGIVFSGSGSTDIDLLSNHCSARGRGILRGAECNT